MILLLALLVALYFAQLAVTAPRGELTIRVGPEQCVIAEPLLWKAARCMRLVELEALVAIACALCLREDFAIGASVTGALALLLAWWIGRRLKGAPLTLDRARDEVRVGARVIGRASDVARVAVSHREGPALVLALHRPDGGVQFRPVPLHRAGDADRLGSVIARFLAVPLILEPAAPAQLGAAR